MILNNIKFSSTVFSWSVRSELIRKNIENLNQLFNVFVKESEANLVQLINTQDSTVSISTDKQFEGEKFVILENVKLNKQTVVAVDLNTTVYTPVMGYNNIIGLLIVKISK